jgi:hypothetical protein
MKSTNPITLFTTSASPCNEKITSVLTHYPSKSLLSLMKPRKWLGKTTDVAAGLTNIKLLSMMISLRKTLLA